MTGSSAGGSISSFWLVMVFLLLRSRLSLLCAFQIVVEAFEARLPELAVRADPVREVLEPARFEPARAALCLAPPRDQPGRLQHLQVLRDRGLAHRESSGQLEHARLAAC